jgi:hypothetical protein
MRVERFMELLPWFGEEPSYHRRTIEGNGECAHLGDGAVRYLVLLGARQTALAQPSSQAEAPFFAIIIAQARCRSSGLAR